MAEQQLLLVLELEHRKEQKALQNYQAAQQQLNLQIQKLEQLNQYRAQYIRNISQDASQGVKSLRYQQSLAFVGQLDQACEMQAKQQSQAVLVAEQRKSIWIQHQQKRKAIEQLIEKKRTAAQLAKSRKEQAVHDDFALQRFIQNQKK